MGAERRESALQRQVSKDLNAVSEGVPYYSPFALRKAPTTSFGSRCSLSTA
jgi:hypothetical protein